MDNPVITINTEDALEKEIIEMYWLLNDEAKFEFTVADLIECFGKSQREISSLAKEKSTFEIFCKECGDSIVSGNLRYLVNNFWNNHIEGEFYCNDCRVKLARSKMPEIYEPVFTAMQIAIDTESWKKLDAETLKTLIIVAQCTSKQEVFDAVFKSVPFQTYQGKIIWNRLNTLDNMKLIWTKRNENRNIETFEVHGELIQRLSEEYPDYFIADKLDISKDTLKMTLQRSMNVRRTQHQQPEFKGTIMLNQTVELLKDVPLYYEAILNDDGSMSLSIVPQYEQDRRENNVDTFPDKIKAEFEKIPMITRRSHLSQEDFEGTDVPW